MTDPLRERLIELPHYWATLIESPAGSCEEFVRWADVEAALRAGPAGEDMPPFTTMDYRMGAEACRAALQGALPHQDYRNAMQCAADRFAQAEALSLKRALAARAAAPEGE